jgi:hypothetical protein
MLMCDINLKLIKKFLFSMAISLYVKDKIVPHIVKINDPTQMW